MEEHGEQRWRASETTQKRWKVRKEAGKNREQVPPGLTRAGEDGTDSTKVMWQDLREFQEVGMTLTVYIS